jgi:hypothetical protein
MSRHAVDEAADILGISTGAVRSRLSRGTLRSVKERGTVYVLLPPGMSRNAGEIPPDMSPSASLFEQMQARIDSLERQLELSGERDRENRRIIAALTSRIPAAELEAPSEARESPQAVEDEPSEAGAEPRPDAPGAQERAQRPWWRRVFGG